MDYPHTHTKRKKKKEKKKDFTYIIKIPFSG